MNGKIERLWLLHDAIRELNDAAYQLSLLSNDKKGEESLEAILSFYSETAGQLGDLVDSLYVKCADLATQEELKGSVGHIQTASTLLRMLNHSGKEGE